MKIRLLNSVPEGFDPSGLSTRPWSVIALVKFQTGHGPFETNW